MLKVATDENGNHIVVAPDPKEYEQYIERTTARFGNYVYRDGEFIPRKQWEKEQASDHEGSE